MNAAAESETLVHATCVAVGDAGVLLRGAPGAGKSDLALRLIDTGAVLVSDDQTRLQRDGAALYAGPPATIAGRLEVRGLGIARLPYRARVRLRLVADLVAADAVERLPEPAGETLHGVAVPLVRLAPFEASAVAKLHLALAQLAEAAAP
jgi:serine kinase of HPr protein (carbohydrate metabolism regulator)